MPIVVFRHSEFDGTSEEAWAISSQITWIWGVGMDRLREFLEAVQTSGITTGRFRGLLHLLVGRRISLSDGTSVSAGMTWREAASALKKSRWDRDAVRDLGLDPKDLPPRDREKFWYAAISRAGLGSPSALSEGDTLSNELRGLGYDFPSGGDDTKR